MRPTSKLFLRLIVLLLIVASVLIGPSKATAQLSALELFDGVWTAVSEYFAGTPRVDWEEVGARYREHASGVATLDELYELLQEMVAQVGDPGTFIRTPAEVEEALSQGDPSQIIGVGMILDMTPDGEVFILSVLGGGPAERAGVRRGERIAAVDGEDTAGMSAADVAAKIRGMQGTVVELSLADPEDRVRTLEIVRAPVTFRYEIEARALEGGIGYISIPSLGPGAEVEFLAALRRMYNTEGLILDFRRFDGVADADVVLKIAALFTQEPLGAIVTRQDAVVLEPTRNWGSTGSPSVPPPTGLDYYQKPLALIVQDAAAINPFSLALVAGMQESGRAILVGRSVDPELNLGGGQVYFQLPGGAILSITSSYLVSLKTRQFVTRFDPDVPVAIDRTYLAKWYRGEDADVDAAIQALTK